MNDYYLNKGETKAIYYTREMRRSRLNCAPYEDKSSVEQVLDKSRLEREKIERNLQNIQIEKNKFLSQRDQFKENAEKYKKDCNELKQLLEPYLDKEDWSCIGEDEKKQIKKLDTQKNANFAALGEYLTNTDNWHNNHNKVFSFINDNCERLTKSRKGQSLSEADLREIDREYGKTKELQRKASNSLKTDFSRSEMTKLRGSLQLERSVRARIVGLLKGAESQRQFELNKSASHICWLVRSIDKEFANLEASFDDIERSLKFFKGNQKKYHDNLENSRHLKEMINKTVNISDYKKAEISLTKYEGLYNFMNKYFKYSSLNERMKNIEESKKKLKEEIGTWTKLSPQSSETDVETIMSINRISYFLKGNFYRKERLISLEKRHKEIFTNESNKLIEKLRPLCDIPDKAIEDLRTRLNKDNRS